MGGVLTRTRDDMRRATQRGAVAAPLLLAVRLAQALHRRRLVEKDQTAPARSAQGAGEERR